MLLLGMLVVVLGAALLLLALWSPGTEFRHLSAGRGHRLELGEAVSEDAFRAELANSIFCKREN